LGGLGLIGTIALIASLVGGSGPLLWPVGAVVLFGGVCEWNVRQLRSARHAIERDLAAWLRP
jgi:hypothetical protein